MGQIRIRIRTILSTIFCLAVAISYLQVYLSYPVLIRPTSFFGDPIINSMILLWGLGSVLITYPFYYGLLAILLVFPLIQLMASLTATMSAVLACISILIFSPVRIYFIRNIRMLISSILLVFGVYFANNHLNWANSIHFADMTQKVYTIRENIECSGRFCHKVHWSLEGRVLSNLKPLEVCQDNIWKCFIGDYSSAKYLRLESTWGSLAVNFGVIFFVFYLTWILQHVFKKSNSIAFNDELQKDFFIWTLIFYSSCFFALFSTIVYRYPVNILFYTSMAYIYFCHQKYQSDNTALNK
jgi:hypothetical protein